MFAFNYVTKHKKDQLEFLFWEGNNSSRAQSKPELFFKGWTGFVDQSNWIAIDVNDFCLALFFFFITILSFSSPFKNIFLSESSNKWELSLPLTPCAFADVNRQPTASTVARPELQIKKKQVKKRRRDYAKEREGIS